MQTGSINVPCTYETRESMWELYLQSGSVARLHRPICSSERIGSASLSEKTMVLTKIRTTHKNVQELTLTLTNLWGETIFPSSISVYCEHTTTKLELVLGEGHSSCRDQHSNCELRCATNDTSKGHQLCLTAQTHTIHIRGSDPPLIRPYSGCEWQANYGSEGQRAQTIRAPCSTV